MALSFLLILAAVNQCLGTLEPQDDPSEKKAQEDRGQGSNEEEDPEDCPVSDLLTLEKAIRLGKGYTPTQDTLAPSTSLPPYKEQGPH